MVSWGSIILYAHQKRAAHLDSYQRAQPMMNLGDLFSLCPLYKSRIYPICLPLQASIRLHGRMAFFATYRLIFACWVVTLLSVVPPLAQAAAGTRSSPNDSAIPSATVSTPSSSQIYPDLSSAALLTALRQSYSPTLVFSYDVARDTLFARIRLEANDSLRCVYTGRALQLDLSQNPTSFAFASDLRISTEHTWPQSKGASEGTTGHSDMHHLYPVVQEANSSRSNYPFADITDTEAEVWYGPGGTVTTPPLSDASTYSKKDNAGSASRFAPRDDHKGDATRALFYFAAIHYAHADWSWFTPQVATLLAWHAADPVSDLERSRSQAIAAYQGNLNPFIEDTTLAARAFSGNFTPTASTPPHVVWINEIHYKNAGTDQDEGVELAGTAGGSLADYVLYFYRDVSTIYAQQTLSGIFPDEQNGCDTLWFSQASIQNGPADGIALVAPDGTVVEFIYFEGALTATAGPASGMTSTNLLVNQSSDTPVGHSLQRIGSGNTADGFTWDGPTAHSPGTRNTNQAFTTSLPVEWTHFAAVVDTQDLILTWTTASETNNRGFSLEVAPAHTATPTFASQAFITGHGTRSTPSRYQHRVADLPLGIHLVRLKQHDADGQFQYSETLTVTIPLAHHDAAAGFALTSAYPNPVATTLTLEIAVAIPAEHTLDVFDLLGRHVYATSTFFSDVGTHTKRLDVAQWAPGQYVVRLSSSDRLQTQTITVLR